MSKTKIPTLRQVKNKFKQAREIKSIGSDVSTGVKGFTAFEWDEAGNAWVGAGGAVVFWKDGVYAAITKSCGSCKNCLPCAEKRKQK